jgi:hypothetical protein
MPYAPTIIYEPWERDRGRGRFAVTATIIEA